MKKLLKFSPAWFYAHRQYLVFIDRHLIRPIVLRLIRLFKTSGWMSTDRSAIRTQSTAVEWKDQSTHHTGLFDRCCPPSNSKYFNFLRTKKPLSLLMQSTKQTKHLFCILLIVTELNCTSMKIVGTRFWLPPILFSLPRIKARHKFHFYKYGIISFISNYFFLIFLYLFYYFWLDQCRRDWHGSQVCSMNHVCNKLCVCGMNLMCRMNHMWAAWITWVQHESHQCSMNHISAAWITSVQHEPRV